MHIRPRLRASGRQARPAFLGLILVLSGCHSLQTSSQDIPIATTPVGIPYLLPKGHLEFSIAVKKDDDGKLKDLELKSETLLLPDQSKVFLLKHGAGLFTRKDQKITFPEGMLTTVHTADDGQAGDALKSIATAWVHSLSLGALNGTLGELADLGDLGVLAAGPGMTESALKHLNFNYLKFGKVPPLGTPPVTAAPPKAEVLRTTYPELLALPQVNKIIDSIDKFHADAWARRFGRILSSQEEQKELLTEGTTADHRLVWTDPSVPLNERLGRYFHLVAVRTGDVEDTGTGGMTPGTNAKDQSGIFVKVPQALLYQLTLQVNSRELYLHRLAKQDAAHAALAPKVAEQNAKVDGWKAGLVAAEAAAGQLEQNLEAHRTTLRAITPGQSAKDLVATITALLSELADITDTADTLKASIKAAADNTKQLAALEREIQTNLVLLHGMATNWPQTSGGRIDLVFNRSTSALVPSSYAVNVPLPNALLGKTTYDLQLTKGVLTSYEIDQPSSAVEFLKIPADVAGTAVDLLTKFVQLKVDLSKQKQDYAKAQLDLEKTRQDLELSKSEQAKKEAGLRADLADNLVRIAENEKKLVTLEKEIADLKKP